MELFIAIPFKVHREAETIQPDIPPQKKVIGRESVIASVAPSLTMSLPMILGVLLMYLAGRKQGSSFSGTYMIMGLTTAVGSAILGTVWGITNYRRRREMIRFSERLRKRSYRRYLEDLDNKIKEDKNYEENLRRMRFPDFSELIDIKRRHVTCYQNTYEYGIECRIGIGNIPYSPPVTYQNEHFSEIDDILKEELHVLKTKYPFMERVPVTISLLPQHKYIIYSNRPNDLCDLLIILLIRISMTYNKDHFALFLSLKHPLCKLKTEWSRFLPSLIIPGEENDIRDENCKLIIAITEDYNTIPRYIAESAMTALVLLKQDDVHKRSADTYEQFPGEGGYTIIISDGEDSEVIDEEGYRTPVSIDKLKLKEASLCARALSSLKDYGSDGCGIVNTISFLELVGDIDVRKNWENSDVITSLNVPIGMGKNHERVFLDLHDKGDGPHGLIAGTTGSGKSELLSTLILSIAIKYPPWEAAFFLVDYKGGGMAAVFAGLPHVVGSISNLSGDIIKRAFMSIRRENERRERLFLEAKVNHISDYHRKFISGEVSEPLPHIFLIIDEFAQLKMEEPEYMQELLALSRVGRSLGMHLILCTQKPGGSVDYSIMSNARFQIALRMQDVMDSKELLKRPDAAFLKNPGRSILKVGNDERYEEFQTAYTMAEYGSHIKKAAYPADEYGRKTAIKATGGIIDIRDKERVRELNVVLELIKEAAKSAPYHVMPLWRDELPDTLSMEDLIRMSDEEYTRIPEGDIDKNISEVQNYEICTIPIGIWDDAVNGRQGILKVNITCGHKLICGMPGSGKTNLIKVILEQVKDKGMRLYIIDCSLGDLESYGKYENIVYQRLSSADEIEDTKRLLNDICRIVKNEVPPAGGNNTVLIIENLGMLLEISSYRLTGSISELLTYGGDHGVNVILSASGVGSRQLPISWQGYMKDIYCLKMKDSFQYSEVLMEQGFRGNIKKTGRGYIHDESGIREFICAKAKTL